MSESDFTPKKILCVAAHADDNEFCFGGSIAKWVAEGAEVAYLICSDGSRGAKDAQTNRVELASTRSREQRNACDVLGVKNCFELSYTDGELAQSRNELTADIVKHIRTFKPDTVLCMDPTFYYSTQHNYVNHTDHRAVGEATFNAVYPMARDELFFSEQISSGLGSHCVENLLMYNLNNPSLVVDISDFFDKKVDAMMSHVSQTGDSDQVLKSLQDISKGVAQEHSFEYGEPFVYLALPTR